MCEQLQGRAEESNQLSPPSCVRSVWLVCGLSVVGAEKLVRVIQWM